MEGVASMLYEEKKFRSCNARIRDYTCSGEKMFDLISYTSFVARLHFVKGAWRLMLLPRWKYSITTQSHIRKFVEDVTGYRITCADMAFSAECKLPLYRDGLVSIEVRCFPCEKALENVTFGTITILG